MKPIKIGTTERRDWDINARWITDQVNARRKEVKPICVFFTVYSGDVNLN